MTDEKCVCSCCKPMTIYEKIETVLMPVIIIEIGITVAILAQGGHIVW